MKEWVTAVVPLVAAGGDLVVWRGEQAVTYAPGRWTSPADVFAAAVDRADAPAGRHQGRGGGGDAMKETLGHSDPGPGAADLGDVVGP